MSWVLDKYYSKNSGAICYLICIGLLTYEDLTINQNNDGFVVISFEPTDERMEAFRRYIEAFKDRKELMVDIVNYNSQFSRIKRIIDDYKILNGMK